MLFWSIVILFVLCFVVKWVIEGNYKHRDRYDNRPDKRTPFQKWCTETRESEMCIIIWGVVLAVCVIGLIVSPIFFLINHSTAEGTKAALLEEHRILTYQLENEYYNNDIEFGKNELFRDIVNFNTSIASGLAMQDNFWLGIYNTDIYDDIPYIELPTNKACE